MPENERLAETIGELSSLLLSEETLTSLLDRVVSLSVEAVGACDASGVCLTAGSRVVTVASSDERVRVLDEIQYRLDDGPCLQAIREGKRFLIDSTRAETRWPRFVKAASELGLRSYLAVPLVEDATTFGALNLYSYRERVFDSDDERAGAAIAVQAAGILFNMRRFERMGAAADRLVRASSSPVNVAVGILMERYACDREEALGRLSRVADNDGESVEAAASSIVHP